jgi:uncharacterized protein (TIGR01777 family)
MKKIILAGGSGYLGAALANHFKSKASEMIILSRRPGPDGGNVRQVWWDGKNPGAWTKELEGSDLVINLAGKSVNCRYSEKNKKEIYSSRLDSTKAIGHAILQCKEPPRVWINSSSATIYQGSFDTDRTESNGIIGDDFSMDVCKKWEAAFDSCITPRTRKVVMRTSIVLGRNGGAMVPLINLVKSGLGGKQGNGQQFVSWIHENDFCRAVEWIADNNSASGIYNVVAPGAVHNAEFMIRLRRSLNIGWGIPIPKLLLKAGAFFIGTEAELVLKSRKVYPQRLLNEGFVFEFSDLKEALNQICRLEERRM